MYNKQAYFAAKNKLAPKIGENICAAWPKTIFINATAETNWLKWS